MLVDDRWVDLRAYGRAGLSLGGSTGGWVDMRPGGFCRWAGKSVGRQIDPQTHRLAVRRSGMHVVGRAEGGLTKEGRWKAGGRDSG